MNWLFGYGKIFVKFLEVDFFFIWFSFNFWEGVYESEIILIIMEMFGIFVSYLLLFVVGFFC